MCTGRKNSVGGVLEQALREVEIQCLASEIPEHLEVDVADMIIGETLHISDLTFENVDITTDGGVSVVSVLAPMAEEVVEEEEEGLEQEEPVNTNDTVVVMRSVIRIC